MSNNLSILRKYVNLSQQELSNISGVTNLYICNYENNSRKMNWNTFLLFLFIFLQNDSTTFYMKQKSIYTEEIKLFLRGVYSDESDLNLKIAMKLQMILLIRIQIICNFCCLSMGLKRNS